MTTPTRHTSFVAREGRQAPPFRETEDIPLQTRKDISSPSHNAERNNTRSISFEDDDPDRSPGSISLHQHPRSLRESNETQDLGTTPESYSSRERLHAHGHDHSGLRLGQEGTGWNRPRLTTIKERFLSLMSGAPLLLRSSPAFGSSSYGAVPRQQDDGDNTEDDTRGEGLENGRTSYAGIRNRIPEGTTAGVPVARSRRGSGKRVRRASSAASDIGMGPESKSSIATGTVMPGRSILDGVEASSSGGEGDGVVDVDEEEDKITEENPPDNSPYAQVRASVSATDNSTLSINTPRMWALSLLFSLAGSATNLFFSLRYPSVSITPVIALVLVHPLGKLWDVFLKRKEDPPEVFENGALQRRKWPAGDVQEAKLSRGQRIRLWLAQGCWNEKEHACVYISSNVSFGFAFATDVIVEQHKFYNQEVPILYQILLTISTQILGYSFAGITRRFLVRPAAMIWPGTLMSTAMFSTMHKSENKLADGWKITRYKFFVIIWAGAFLWYFVPGLLMPALSYFNVITWLAPKSVVISNLFGVSSGLGMFPITFDWAQIAYIGSPLLTPWWAAANMVTGLAVVMWLIAPILYYKNVLFASYLPMLSSSVFDNTGKPYDVKRILTPDFLFDEAAYKKYSAVYLPITYALSYAVQFAALSALVTHTICWYGKDIWNQSKVAWSEWQNGREKTEYQPIPNTDGDDQTPLPSHAQVPETGMGAEDVHCRLMRRYDDVPLMWYLMTFIVMLAISIFVIEYYPVYLPWYGLLLALSITILLYIPVGIIMAITNQHSSLYLICQLICGIVFPGRPVANMVFVTYSYISSAQGIKFSSDLKLGHYMKIPPKILFTVQMVATLVSSMTQIGVLNWMFSFIPGICTPEAINGFNCPIARVHFNGSILWGVVGPQRFFGPGGIYRPLVWAFLVGALGPIGVWLLGRRSKKNIWRMVNLPVLFGGLSWIPPATGLNFSVWALVCFLFNHVVRKRASAWWGKYTMTMSAALDSGLAFAVIFVFFGFIYPGWMEGFKWWGTEIYKQGCDWMACPYLTLEPGEKFGT